MSSKSVFLVASVVAAMFFQINATRVVAGLPKTEIILTSTQVVPAAKGRARYEASAVRRKLNVQAENLASLEGRPAVLYVAGVVVARTTVTLGKAKFELDTNLGQRVPVIATGTAVSVVINGRAIVTGSF